MEREEVLHVAASAEDAAFVACSSPDNDHAFLGSPADREPSEPPPLSDGDDRDHEQVPEIDQDVDHDSGNGVMTVDDLKQRIIKQASLSLSLSRLISIPMNIRLKGWNFSFHLGVDLRRGTMLWLQMEMEDGCTLSLRKPENR